MDSEKIIQDLKRRFAVPLPEFYKRRIVVWIDEDQEFVDKLDEITVNGAKVVALTGSNNFYVKKLLAVDDPTSNYLVYRPFAYESDEDNWLLDVELYGEEFRADLVSMWMDEMGIPQTPALRRCMKKYHKFFENKLERRDKVTAVATTIATPAQMQLAIMAVLAEVDEPKPNRIIKAVLQHGLFVSDNPIYQAYKKYGIEEAFWKMVEQGTGFETEDWDNSDDQTLSSPLAQLAAHIFLTATTRTLRQEYLSGLQNYISSAHQAYCYDFVSDWIHADGSAYKGSVPETGEGIREIAEYLEEELKLPQRFMKLTVEDHIYGRFIFPERKSYGMFCIKTICDRFPDGIKLKDQHDMALLREYVFEKYGDIGMPSDDRKIRSAISDSLVLRGLGIYTAKENVHIDAELLDEIKNYIDGELEYELEISYAKLFSIFEQKIRRLSNIDNPYFLQGVLKLFFADEYDYLHGSYLKARVNHRYHPWYHDTIN